MSRQGNTRASRPRRFPRLRPGVLGLLAAILLAVLALSCSGVRYYSQTAWGGAGILVKRQPIDRLLEPDRARVLSAATRERLELAREIRDFASRELALPDNRSYRTYADLERPYAVWNVVAAPRLGLEPVTWCYPIAGCAAYRGYFSERAANRFAERLADDGFDVRVGGVSAYSTLGWFADPVLSTFLDRADADLAGLIFHELAHQVAWARDDSLFNESFATAVEVRGVEDWLAATGREAELVAWQRRRTRARDLNRFLLAVRGELEVIYVSKASDERKLESKAALFRSLPGRYRRDVVAAWAAAGDASAGGGFSDRGEWLARLNNADLVSIATYNDLAPAFLALLDSLGGDWPAFHTEVERLAALPAEERRRELSLASGSAAAGGAVGSGL